MTSDEKQGDMSADAVIEIFGGVRPTARALSTDETAVPPSTVMDWKRKGTIPRWWRPTVEAAVTAKKTADAALGQ